MVFVFDLDDTICDTDGYSESYMIDFFAKHNLPYKQIASKVRYAESKFDWSNEQALEWYRTYGDEMMKNFPVKNNAVEVINKLYAQGHTIIIATARAKDWHTNPYAATLEWISKVGLRYHRGYIGRGDKESICKEVGADVFVDDDIGIVERVNQTCGCKVFLATTEYNRDLKTPDGVDRINDLSSLLRIAEKSSEETSKLER